LSSPRAAAASPLPITSAQIVHIAGGQSIPVIRLWVELWFATTSGVGVRRDCLLDTGAPLCVVPYEMQRRHGFSWIVLPGPWPAGFMTWLGVPCLVGSMEVWGRAAGSAALIGPLRFVAKFAQASPRQLTGELPILLGLNFLAEHRAEVRLQCHTPPQAGVLELP
jgi:hypothetical protein